jgi:uncharacterized membrane protein YfcA
MKGCINSKCECKNKCILYIHLFIMSSTLATVCLGVVAGLAGGALGQSGAEIMVPGLLVMGIASNFKTAAGTVLLTILPPLSLMAIVTY